MEEGKTKEQYEKEIAELANTQSSKTQELADKKKAGVPQSELGSLIEELKNLKAQTKALTTELQHKYPQEKPKKNATKVNEEKLKRAEEAKAQQGKGKKQKNKPEPGKKKKAAAEYDTSDVTEAVLSGPFAGTRYHPNEPRLLPKEGQRNVLITSALPYVNNVPHLGNIIGCVLSADVYARYCRLRGVNTLFVCGTDEYGTATETKAAEEGVTPLEICNKYSKIHDQIYQWFGISFDHFGRTTTEEQTQIAQDIFSRLHANGHLVEQTVEQLYCPTCDRYLADRLVEGTCPFCAYHDARGDQCDKCQKLINAVELINPRCKTCSTTPVKRDSEHLFLDLPRLTNQLEPWIESSSVKGRWTSNGIAITKSWLTTGLQPRCITRDLKWGTPVPLPKYKGKVFYVWFDAPIGYLSITATYTKEWEKWWKNPSQVQLYQFMGKDNIPFHTVVFPSSLLGTGEQWTLLHHVSTTEYLNYENKLGEKDKFSKSRKTGVFGDGAKGTHIPQEVWRYYLLACRPETSDTLFSWDDMATKNNTELLANLGNFCNRCLAFTHDRLEGTVPAHELTEADHATIEKVNKQLALYIQALDEVSLKEGLRIAIIDISAEGNGYLQEQKPWDHLKAGDKKRCDTIIALSLNLAVLLGVILEPFLPSFTEKLLRQLDYHHIPIPDVFSLDLIPAGHKIGIPKTLFRKLEAEEIKGWREVFG